MMTKMFQINIEQASNFASSNTHNITQSNGQATKKSGTNNSETMIITDFR